MVLQAECVTPPSEALSTLSLLPPCCTDPLIFIRLFLQSICIEHLPRTGHCIRLWKRKDEAASLERRQERDCRLVTKDGQGTHPESLGGAGSMSPSRGGDAGDRGDSGGRGDSGEVYRWILHAWGWVEITKSWVFGGIRKDWLRESWREEQRSNMHSLLRGLDFIQAAGE